MMQMRTTKLLLEQIAHEFDGIRAKRPSGDGVLIAAKVLLYVLLVGLILAFVMSIVGLIAHVASLGVEVLRPPIFSVGSPVVRALLSLAALDFLIGAVVRLIALINTVESGEAFSNCNARRLEWIGGAILGLMAVGFAASAFQVQLRGDINGFPLSIDPAPGGVAIALMLFILARVFRKGVEMRRDLEGTV